jgi:hypothetical protein
VTATSLPPSATATLTASTRCFDRATDALRALATEHVRGKLAISCG